MNSVKIRHLYCFIKVSADEIGALQGAADTLRTVSGILGGPLMSSIFAQSIKADVQQPGWALYSSAIVSASAALLFYISEYKEFRIKRKKEKYLLSLREMNRLTSMPNVLEER